jgi:DNA-binding transcriptional LysR family regulator
MQISNLEKRLNMLLFDRSGRNITLTEAAQVLLPLAREILNFGTHIEETMASVYGTLKGHLQIACSTSAGKYILPRLIARFRQLHPGVRVTVGICSFDGAVEQICNGQCHLGILSSEANNKDVEYRPFFDDEVVLIVPRQHPWAERENVTPQELVSQPFIMREETAGTHRVMKAGLLEHGIWLHDLDVVMELGNAEAIESSVEAGIGIAFVSRVVARRGIEAGHVAEVPIEGLHLTRRLYMICHGRRAQTRAQNAFWNFVHDQENKALLEIAGQVNSVCESLE